MRGLATFLVVVFMIPLTGVLADDVIEQFEDPAQRALYEKLINEVRCLVCQNQTIGDSTATLAGDLRREIGEQISAGQTESQIKEFLTDRYGDFILYRPRFEGAGLLLWLVPALLLLTGILLLGKIVRRRSGLPIGNEDLENQKNQESGEVSR
jgi:cytochrome c-type biogenesis protein CcmH